MDICIIYKRNQYSYLLNLLSFLRYLLIFYCYDTYIRACTNTRDDWTSLTIRTDILNTDSDCELK